MTKCNVNFLFLNGPRSKDPGHYWNNPTLGSTSTVQNNPVTMNQYGIQSYHTGINELKTFYLIFRVTKMIRVVLQIV